MIRSVPEPVVALKTCLRALLGVVLVVGASASAHAVLAESTPAAGAVVDASPSEIELRFSEGVEVDFSVFRVLRLDAEVDLSADDAQMRLNGLAAALLGPYLAGAEAHDEEVALEAHAVEGTRSEVVLELADELVPGHYVVMWRVLSEDTHIIDGHIVFTVVAAE